jgi:hypothetical protein
MEMRPKKSRQTEFTVLIIGCLIFSAMFVFSSKADVAVIDGDQGPVETDFNESQNYSRFQHSNPMHARMPCLLCHKRDDRSTVPKLSGHQPCSGCHVQQFADSNSQMCSICHTNTQTGATKRFPGLRSFNTRFDHSKHVQHTNCATCHKPTRRGIAFSVPSGVSAHTSCYQCHGPKTEVGSRNIGSCGVCHVAGRPAKNSEWAAAYSKNFDHSAHNRSGKLACTNCHTVKQGMAHGNQVTAPRASMHFAKSGSLSCASCHNNKRAFGGNDFKDCKLCHEGQTFKF